MQEEKDLKTELARLCVLCEHMPFTIQSTPKFYDLHGHPIEISELTSLEAGTHVLMESRLTEMYEADKTAFPIVMEIVLSEAQIVDQENHLVLIANGNCCFSEIDFSQEYAPLRERYGKLQNCEIGDTAKEMESLIITAEQDGPIIGG